MTNDQRRYSEWECGKLVGVVDCGTQLNYDEEHDLVIRTSDNNVDLTGVGKPFTGKCETCHLNGTLERRVNFVNGKEHGTDTTTYESGCPQVVRTHINGVESGTWQYFYDSTNFLAWEINYYLGLKQGKTIYLAPDGDTTLLEHYKEGQLDGKKITYYDDSKVKREANYKAGSLNGKFITYSEKGIIQEELNYKNGKKDGENKYYYDDGVLLQTENWSNGIKDGDFKVFFYEGAVQISEHYKNGKRDGTFEEFHPNGIVKEKIVYDEDVRLEEIHYDDHGRITFQFPDPAGAEDDAAPGKKKKKKKD